MKTAGVLLTLFWACLLASCREVSFPVTQPAGVAALQEVPPALRGAYVTKDDQTGERSDTLLIESWGYHFKDARDKDWLGRGTLSDSLVVKFYKDYYFVNFRMGDQWVLRLIQQRPDGNIRFLSIDLGADGHEEVLKQLSKRMKVREFRRGEDTYFQINPTPDQLIDLIDSGFFKGATWAQKSKATR
jgi:hypothetical protein